MAFNYKRQRRRDDLNGGIDDWLMTYADMITLLLCFFAVFLAVSLPEKKQMEQARGVMMQQFARTTVKTPAKSDLVPSVAGDKFPHEGAMQPVKTDQPFDRMPSIIDQYRGNKNLEIKQGDRLITIAMNSATLFGSGAAELSGEGGATLSSLLPIVNNERYHDYTITVEGHTDDDPIATAQFPSNWELSASRAAAVVRYLVGNGVAASRLRAVGMADIAPKLPNRDDKGHPIPANQAQNRRVVVKLEKVNAESAN